MNVGLAVVAASTEGIVLRYAAAFFLVAVALGMVFVLIRLGRTLRETEKLVLDVDREAVPLMRKAGETLDGVNTELQKIDSVMATVVDVTERVDATTKAVESVVSTPARKAAAFGAGVTQAVSSFFQRGGDAGTDYREASGGDEWTSSTAGETFAWSDSGAGESPAEPADSGAPSTAAGTDFTPTAVDDPAATGGDADETQADEAADGQGESSPT